MLRPTSDALTKRIKTARLAQSRAAVELWNERLALLHAAGDLAGLLAHITGPAELAGDNCTCNNACNAPCAALDLRSPPNGDLVRRS